MLFSILIAHYNNARFLQTAIDSVLCQTYTNWEIILVDDGSTDHFETILENYKGDGRINVFRNEKITDVVIPSENAPNSRAEN